MNLWVVTRKRRQKSKEAQGSARRLSGSRLLTHFRFVSNYLLQILAQAVNKQIDELHEKTEAASIELETFRRLRDHEMLAAPRRLHSLTDEVRRQEERERELQKRYDTLRREAQSLVERMQREQASISVEPVLYQTEEAQEQI